MNEQDKEYVLNHPHLNTYQQPWIPHYLADLTPEENRAPVQLP